MGLLLDAAIAWNDLHDISYVIDVVKNGKKEQIELTFLSEDFPHIAGMQYATDVDFGIRKAEYYGGKLIPILLNKRIDDSKIEKGKNWDQISGRLSAIINLQNILDNDFKIVSFNKYKVRGYCTIEAEFLIKSEVSKDIYFVFLDKESGRHYCRSAFRKSNKDYTENQTPVTVLQKIKVINTVPKILFLKPGYEPNV